MKSIIGNQFSLYLYLLFYTSKILKRYKKLDEMYLTYILQSKYPIFKQVSKQSLANFFRTNYSTKLSYYFLSEHQETTYDLSNSMKMIAVDNEQWNEQLRKAALDPGFTLQDEVLFNYLISVYSLSKVEEAKIIFHYIKLNQIKFTYLINNHVKAQKNPIHFVLKHLSLPDSLLTTLAVVGVHKTEDVLNLSTDAIIFIFNVFCLKFIYSFTVTDLSSHHSEEVFKTIESIDKIENNWISKYQLLIYENIPFFVSFINNKLITEKLLFLNIIDDPKQLNRSSILHEIMRNIDDTLIKLDEEMSLYYNPSLFNLSSFVSETTAKLPIYFVESEIPSFAQHLHGQKLDLLFRVLDISYHKVENIYIKNNVTNCDIIDALLATCKSPFSINDCLNIVRFIGKDEVKKCLDKNSKLKKIPGDTYIKIEEAFSEDVKLFIIKELDYLLENLPIPIVTVDKLFGRLLVQKPKLFKDLPFIYSSSDFLNVLKEVKFKDFCIDKIYISRQFAEMNEHFIFQLFLENKETLTAEEFRKFKKVMQMRGGMTFARLKVAFSEHFHSIDKNIIKRNTSLNYEPELLEHIKNCLDMVLEQVGVIDSGRFRGYTLFPKINQKWNKHILKIICEEYYFDKYVIEEITNENYLLRRINHG